MNYSIKWDLTTIPDFELNSEFSRRGRARKPRTTNLRLLPCASCGMELTATQRRKPCPKCGHKEPR